jgi:hypothetical protein
MKIENKIVGYAVNQPDEENADAPRPEFRRELTDGGAEVIRMHERLERPEMLVGSTYKVKTPVSDHAMYVTVNDIILPTLLCMKATSTSNACRSTFSSTQRISIITSGLLL